MLTHHIVVIVSGSIDVCNMIELLTTLWLLVMQWCSTLSRLDARCWIPLHLVPHSRRYLISKGHLVSGTGDNAGKSSSPSTPCLAPLTWPADHDIQRDYLHSIIRPTPLSSLITRTVSYQGESHHDLPRVDSSLARDQRRLIRRAA